MVRCAICHPFRSCHRYSCPTIGSGRHPFCARRVRSRQATTLDPQSFAAAVTESTHFRSPCRRFVCSPHSPRPFDPFSHRSETFYPASGFLLFAVPSVVGIYWRMFFSAFLVLGFGLAVSVAHFTTVVMRAVDQNRAGTAS